MYVVYVMYVNVRMDGCMHIGTGTRVGICVCMCAYAWLYIHMSLYRSIDLSIHLSVYANFHASSHTSRWNDVISTADSVHAPATSQVVVLQGERPLAKDNKKLGTFRLDGIPTAPKGHRPREESGKNELGEFSPFKPLQSEGVPKIEVSFDIDVEAAC